MRQSPSQQIIDEVLSWPGVTSLPHQYEGVEFRVGRRQLGHLHGERTADLPLRRALRDQLVATGRVHVHRWRPNSGWVTLRIDSDQGLAETIRLMRVSYDRATRDRAPAQP